MLDLLEEARKAIRTGDCAKIDELIGEGLDVNAKTEGDNWNFLHIASDPISRPPNPSLVKHLIHLGVDISARDRHLWTPLHFAVRTGNSEVVKLLIDAGAEVDPVNDKQITPLHQSVLNARPNLDITEMLLAAGADPDVDRGRGTIRHFLSVVSRPDIGAIRDLVNRYYPQK